MSTHEDGSPIGPDEWSRADGALDSPSDPDDETEEADDEPHEGLETGHATQEGEKMTGSGGVEAP